MPLVTLGREARLDVAALVRDFGRKNWPEAIRNRLAAVNQAMKQIADDPNGGLRSPRPYPALAQPGRAWTKAGRYWFVHGLGEPPVVTTVFHDAADIPGRLQLAM